MYLHPAALLFVNVEYDVVYITNIFEANTICSTLIFAHLIKNITSRERDACTTTISMRAVITLF